MNLIFRNGENLFRKEQDLINKFKEFLQNPCGIKLSYYQEQFLKSIKTNAHFDYSIYGDDFKIDIIPQNVRKYCALLIKDYDENQKLESEINIDLSKEELDQFINLLQIIKSKM